MIQKITLALTSLLAVFVLSAAPVGAINVFKECDSNTNKNTSVCKAKDSDDANSMIKSVINTILIILGSVAVLMIVIGGIRYVTSNGEAAHVKSAKDTILYAVIGLVVAILAYAIVNFVITKLVG